MSHGCRIEMTGYCRLPVILAFAGIQNLLRTLIVP